MIAGGANRNFLTAHYEWIALGVAAVALVVAAVIAVGSFGQDPEECADEAARQYQRTVRPGETGVKSADLQEYERASTLLDSKKVPRLIEFATDSKVAKDGNFLTYAARKYCENCHRPMALEAKVCPFCGKAPTVKELPPPKPADTDGDGMTDDWEKKYDLNPNDPTDAALDSDGDEFTNLEEFVAKTNPKDETSHPDYFQFVSLSLPLVETKLPFYFEKAMKLPSGYRFYFKDPFKKNDYGTRGRQYTPLTGEDIGDTGFKVIAFNEKSEVQEIKAAAGEKALKKSVDVSTATIERQSDKRRFDLLVGSKKLLAVDVQAKLVCSRGKVREMKAVKGDAVTIGGTKYIVKNIEVVGKGAKVTLEDPILHKFRVVEALER